MENLTPKKYKILFEDEIPSQFFIGIWFCKACQFNITNSQSILHESWNESLEWVIVSMLKPPKTNVGHEGSAMMINLCNTTQTLLQGRLKRININK
jgi:hypothetical protein